MPGNTHSRRKTRSCDWGESHQGLNVFAKVLRGFKERIGSLSSKGYQECLLQQEPHYEKSKNNHTFKWKKNEEILDEKIGKLYLINS